ncbi:MAG: DUF4381 domain-containing protein [Magnetococcales bacterium]|nr:DUF4381 domain-containing protein [Magnetococcales bacterium]
MNGSPGTTALPSHPAPGQTLPPAPLPTDLQAILTTELRGVHEPPPPPFWPPAPGWWILLLAILVAGVLTVRTVQKQRRKRRLLVAARSALTPLANAPHPETPQALRHHLNELNALLRRVAMARFGREQVAGLQGEAWVQFLDRTAGQKIFSNNQGTTLITLHHMPDDRLQTMLNGDDPANTPLDLGTLHIMVHDWIERTALPSANASSSTPSGARHHGG